MSNESSGKKEQRAQQHGLKACEFAQTLVAQETGLAVNAEVVENQWLWTECREVFKQFMKLWQDFTLVTLGVDSQGRPAGWLVEKRKETCGPQVLSDAEIEKKARELGRVRLDMRLVGVERVPIDDKRGFAIAHFSAKDASIDVCVNHTTGEIMGTLPKLEGDLKPIPLEDTEVREAQKQAWDLLKADLEKRVGLDAAQSAEDLLKLGALTAFRDKAGNRVYTFSLWKFYTTCDVTIEEKTGEVVAWYVEEFQYDAPENRLTEDLAKELAQRELKAETGVQGPKVEFSAMEGEVKATVHWWHAEQDANIEGDHTTVFLNADNGRIFSTARKWRAINPELFKGPLITSEQAEQAASAHLKRASSQAPGEVIGKSVIQIAADDEKPSPVKDVLVWRVGYDDPAAFGFTEVDVDCRTGEVARVTGW